MIDQITNSNIRDSDITWLGNIPSNWSIQPLKRLASISTGNRDTIERDPNGEYPFFIRSEKVERIASYSYDGEAVLIPGDGNVGSIFHHYIGKYDCHQRVYNITDFSQVSGRFVYYYMSACFKYEVDKGTAKSTVESLRMPMLMDFPVCFGNLEEQEKIVSILDDECHTIDEIIRQQSLLVDALEKLKQSIISEAVTKGLDPDVSMKDSGIQWIGEIPESWEIIKLKNLGELYSGGVDKKIREGESQYRSIHYMDVYRNSLKNLHDSSDFLTVSCPPDKVDKCRLLPGDILFTTSSETPDDIGHSALICDQMDDVLFGYHLIRFRPGNKILPSFAKYVFGSTSFRSWLSYRANGMTRYGVDNESFSMAYVQVPPLDVQVKISEYLDSVSLTIDSLITLHGSIIDSVSDLKSSVIYEYITGKKSVPEEAI